MDIIENRILNITSQDVSKETDLSILLSWRTTLREATNSMKMRIYILKGELDEFKDEESKSKVIRTTDARNHAISFIDIINTRIRELRGTINKKNSQQGFSSGGYMKYLKAFRTLAKEKIDEPLFQEIDENAKKLTGWIKE